MARPVSELRFNLGRGFPQILLSVPVAIYHSVCSRTMNDEFASLEEAIACHIITLHQNACLHSLKALTYGVECCAYFVMIYACPIYFME